MNREFNQYANKVVGYMNCRGRKKKKIKNDILDMLNERLADRGDAKPDEVMGPAIELARELSGDDKLRGGFEYISEARFLGLPLVHVTNNRGGIAKGIIAVGDVAIGGLAIGGLAIGIVPLGGFSFGLLALGGFALGYSAIGGIAVAYDIAIGGFAVAYQMAIGGLAVSSNIAIGGETTGKLMIYSQGYSDHIADYIVYSGQQKDLFLEKASELYPNMSPFKSWILRLFI